MTKEAGIIVSVRLPEVVCTGLPESVTLKVSAVLVTGADGVPVMAPVPGFKERFAGRVPEVRDQVKGAVPPVVASVVE